jgi:hypothetical protein
VSAELLRRAAEVLRLRADSATAGPWVATWQGQDLRLHQGGDPGEWVAEWGYTVAPHRPESYDEVDRADPDYIALMHPPVAHAMADLLDEVAESVEQDGGVIQDSTTAGAVDLARAILREES